MKKDSFSRLFLLILTAVAAVAGFILRRCQLAYELQANGSLANGSRLHIILGILLAVYAVAAIICLLPQQKLRRWREVFRPQPVLSLLFLLAALGFAIGNLLLLFERPASTAEDGFAVCWPSCYRFRDWRPPCAPPGSRSASARGPIPIPCCKWFPAFIWYCGFS